VDAVLKAYPMVTGEMDTMRLVAGGASIARYGDGEFKLCHGASIKSQVYHSSLANRLRGILGDSGQCLVGIPNIRSDTPKGEFWGKFMRESKLLSDRPYVSAFITRPDSAPWLDTPEYWDLLISLWRGQSVTVVCGSGKSLHAEDLVEARSVTEIHAPRQHAWAEYASIVARVEAAKNHRVLISLGPTATVMAVDLCALGFHAIDGGHVGLFLRKHRKGIPLVLDKDDKQAV
jgi:Glycosyltransferase GT-D fold